MAALTRDLFAELLVALRANHALYDLRTTDSTYRVQIGEYEAPPVSGVPFVAIRYESGRSGYGVASMGEYEVGGAVVCVAWAPCDSDDPSERSLDAMDLANDCITAVQAAHATEVTYPYLFGFPRMEAEDIEVFGDGANVPGNYGVATWTFRFQAIKTRGI
jgi:hypothetical protein